MVLFQLIVVPCSLRVCVGLIYQLSTLTAASTWRRRRKRKLLALWPMGLVTASMLLTRSFWNGRCMIWPMWLSIIGFRAFLDLGCCFSWPWSTRSPWCQHHRLRLTWDLLPRAAFTDCCPRGRSSTLYSLLLERIWQCGCGYFSNNFSCQNACQWCFFIF